MAFNLKSHIKRKMKAKGVSLFDPFNFGLLCEKCGKIWVPVLKEGKMPKGYWKCPNDCNS